MVYQVYNFGVEQLLDMAINHPKITHALVNGVSEAAIKNTQKWIFGRRLTMQFISTLTLYGH